MDKSINTTMKNTDNNNEPPNDDDDATAVAVDCFPWQDKQPVLPYCATP